MSFRSASSEDWMYKVAALPGNQIAMMKNAKREMAIVNNQNFVRSQNANRKATRGETAFANSIAEEYLSTSIAFHWRKCGELDQYHFY